MVPLVVHSHYSLMWGAGSVDALVARARNLGYTRLALTDRDNLYGLWTFLPVCRRRGMIPIIGVELSEPGSARTLVCLAKDQTGYRNICRLVTRRHCRFDFRFETDLPKYGRGLVVLIRDPILMKSLVEAGLDIAAAMPRDLDPSARRARQAALELNVPAVAVPDCYFPAPEDFHLHRVLRAIALNTDLSRLETTSIAPADSWLASPEEYERRFAVCPETIEASRILSDRLEFYHPDTDTVMPPWEGNHRENAASVLRRSAYEGAQKKYGHDLPEAVVERLEHELKLIEEKNFSSYFLVVQDIVRRSPRICGRGSGAASLAAYCLGITNVCPIKHDLYFERFINAQRKDPPDIDVDFAWDERDDILNSVLNQYRGRSAMVCNHVFFQPRMAIREVAKVYGLTAREINEVAKRLPWFWRGHEFETDMRSKIYEHPRSVGLEFPEPWPEILDLAQKIVGTPRNLSVHPGGVVITPGPIDEYGPIEFAPKGVPIMQWEKDGVEEAGLVKIDLLGNRSLGVIRDAMADVRNNGLEIDEIRWEPEDDAPTRETVAQGLTMGCFYIESPAMRLLQKKSGRGDFEHLVIHSSIIRPAANEYIQEYLRRLKGGCWEPIHPLLGDVLEETFGIMVYQEDVSRVAVALAGFSHAEADGLRKIMSKKDKETALRDYYDKFAQGAGARGVAPDKIQAIWKMILSFSGYSFCKPHSASYARVSFQAAYLKTHFPAEFMAAVISNQGGYYHTFAYVSEARRLGLTVLPPDVNHSDVTWHGRDRNIRVGLQALKGLGQKSGQRIVEERRRSPYKDFDDFYHRALVDEDEARALIHSGALDDLSGGLSRAQLLWSLASRGRSGTAARSDHSVGLFPEDTPPPPILPPGREIDRLRRQYAVLGFLVDRHPIVLFEDQLSGRRLVKAESLSGFAGRRVGVAGWLLTGKLVRTRHGEAMQFLTFEDDTAIFEATFFPAVYRRYASVLDWGRPHLLGGRVEENHGAVTLTVDRVQTVEKP